MVCEFGGEAVRAVTVHYSIRGAKCAFIGVYNTLTNTMREPYDAEAIRFVRNADPKWVKMLDAPGMVLMSQGKEVRP